MPRYNIENDGDGFYTIRDVPIFQEHTNRGFECNNGWLQSAVQNFSNQKASGYRPPIIIGHNVKGTEKEAVGFLDNLAIKGKQLYADLTRVPKVLKEKIVQNAYPSRSVEVLPQGNRILALALLGGTAPHFALPQMTYSAQGTTGEQSQWVTYDRSHDMAGFSDEQKAELNESVGSAINEALPGAEHYAQEEEAEVYELGSQEALEVINQDPAPEIYQDEESGRFYSIDEEGNAYVYPQFVEQYFMSDENDAVEGYAIDEETGVLYEDGEPVGQLAYNEEEGYPGQGAVATDPMENEEIDPGDVETPGNEEMMVESPMFEEVDRESSDQFPGPARQKPIITTPEAATEGMAMQLDPEQEQLMYNLTQQVDRLTTANELLQAGKRAEGIKGYLMQQKQLGAPVGDVEQMTNYLLTQTEEQIAMFQSNLENQPKIDLSNSTESLASGPHTIATFDSNQIRQDYSANKATYSALGVDENDLQYADFVRVNTMQGASANSTGS